jgi:hypothetical protein
VTLEAKEVGIYREHQPNLWATSSCFTYRQMHVGNSGKNEIRFKIDKYSARISLVTPNYAARGFACLREKKQVHKTDFKVLESYYMFGCRTFGETMLQLAIEKYECEMLEYGVEREIV